MMAATRSEPECRASEVIAIEPDMMPTTSLKAISTELETMETAAACDLRRVLVRSPWASRMSESLVTIQQPLPSQAFEEGSAGQCAVAGLVLVGLWPFGHSEVCPLGDEDGVVAEPALTAR